jgi:hypothetical protein
MKGGLTRRNNSSGSLAPTLISTNSIINEMVDLLKEHPNFFLVGCNTNGDTFEEVNVDQMYTGNRTLYLTAKAAQKHIPMIESRLDGDDALYVKFYQDIQSRTSQSLGRDKLKWLMFCS